jgi:hypothetical protein
MTAKAIQTSVPPRAWAADREARERGRVQMFNTRRPDGLDGWTIRLDQWELLRAHILDTIDAFGDDDGAVPLQAVVTLGQEHLATHPSSRVAE